MRMRIKWLGHASFLLVSPGGVRVICDPFDKSVPYPPVSEECDVVTMSHEHFDHNDLAGVKGSPKVLRGLKDNQAQRLTETVGDVTLRTVPTYHDGAGGSKRGQNAVFVMDVGGLKVVHLGDLGHELDQEAVSEIGPCDVLLVPVGGYYTIGPDKALKVTQALKPRLVIPMHYKTGYIPDWPIGGPESFLSAFKTVKNVPNSVDVTATSLPDEMEAWVFASP